MKTQSFNTNMYTAFIGRIRKSGVSITAAICLFFSVVTLNAQTPSGSYPENAPATGIETMPQRIMLKGETAEQSDLLRWEMSDPSNVASFTVQSSGSNEMVFTDVAVISPAQCADPQQSGCYTLKCVSGNDPAGTYYKIKATMKDKTVSESNFIYIKKTAGNVAALDISDIKGISGLITLTIKSPKAQNVTLYIVNRNGQILTLQNISAKEGDNEFSFDAGKNGSPEMLIFSLNNEEEQITKKYMLASAW